MRLYVLCLTSGSYSATTVIVWGNSGVVAPSSLILATRTPLKETEGGPVDAAVAAAILCSCNHGVTAPAAFSWLLQHRGAHSTAVFRKHKQLCSRYFRAKVIVEGAQNITENRKMSALNSLWRHFWALKTMIVLVPKSARPNKPDPAQSTFCVEFGRGAKFKSIFCYVADPKSFVRWWQGISKQGKLWFDKRFELWLIILNCVTSKYRDFFVYLSCRNNQYILVSYFQQNRI